MTERYVQKVEVELRHGARRDQILGIVFQLMGLGLIPVAIYLNYWVFAAAGVALAFGIWLTQKFYSTPREYEYALSGSRLIVSRANLVGRGRRMLEIALADVSSYDGFYDMQMPSDFVAAGSVNAPGVKVIVFTAEGTEHRLLFEPDDYLHALLLSKLRSEQRGALHSEAQ